MIYLIYDVSNKKFMIYLNNLFITAEQIIQSNDCLKPLVTVLCFKDYICDIKYKLEICWESFVLKIHFFFNFCIDLSACTCVPGIIKQSSFFLFFYLNFGRKSIFDFVDAVFYIHFSVAMIGLIIWI